MPHPIACQCEQCKSRPAMHVIMSLKVAFLAGSRANRPSISV
jgi:hypothetical protein